MREPSYTSIWSKTFEGQNGTHLGTKGSLVTNLLRLLDLEVCDGNEANYRRTI